MPYDSQITRANSQALVPEQVSSQLLQGLQNQSVALNLFTSVGMSTNQTRMPVISALPSAYFVSGDTGLKQTSQATWANKFLNVEELAVIVPIPEAVLDDTAFDIWGNVRPLLENEIARTLDAAILFGDSKPASWPDDIYAGATAAGHVVDRGTSTAAEGSLAGDVSDAFSLVEQDGYDVTGAVAHTRYKGFLRSTRSVDGVQLSETTMSSIYGVPVSYPARGLWPVQGTVTPAPGVAEFIAGDFSQGIIGLRQDFTYKLLDQAVLQDDSGVIQYNLAQQDMVALRVVFRCAYQVANTINYDNTAADGSRYPWAVVESPDI